MAISFTDRQINAIEVPSGALVSAAAGSGKTAVLVERVIRKITGENPVSADKLLIVTFTNSAAKEMRVRIEERLAEECRNNPNNRELIKQKIKIKNAKICTIDSFCIELVRENFDRLDINPDFNIGEETALREIAETAMNQVLNRAFEEGGEDFGALLEAVTSDYDEGELKNFILAVYKFSQNMPFPDLWLEEKISNEVSFDAILNEAYFRLKTTALKGIKLLLAANRALETLSNVSEKYEPAYKKAACDLQIIADCADKQEWDTLVKLIPNFSFDKILTPRGFKENPLVVSAKAIKESITNEIKGFATIFSRNYSDTKRDYEIVNKCKNVLFALTIEFSKIYFSLRKEKNLLTFSDTEHLALNLLCTQKDGEIVVRDIAKEIIERFDEVLVDEFQDVNNMQNILFSVLSNDEKKLFAVGDIKQSIFGFRGANPQNFNEKKNRYIPFDNAKEGDLRKVVLDSNFRSKRNICNAINFIFDIVMNLPDSEIVYDNDESLKSKADFPNDENIATEIHLVETSTNNALDEEGKSIAAYIKDFIENGKIYDKKIKDYRSPSFRDFTILLRQQKDRATILSQTLEKYGIPVSYNLGNFMDSTEIQIFTSLLSAVENPTRDIPLLSILMSPMFCFTADEIAKISVGKKKNSLISAVTAAANKGDNKALAFLQRLKKWRSYSSSLSISDLINEIFIDSDIMNIVGVLPEGEKRKNNLQQLHSIAVSYDNNGFSRNISAFLKHLETISSDIRAAGSSADEDSVSICTIHYSKGLQFPICILADTTQEFKTPNGRNRLLLGEEYGASFTFNDYEENNTRSQILREVLVKKQSEQQFQEELRLLYVALTRAEQKLVISVAHKDVFDYIKSMSVQSAVAESTEQYRELLPPMASYADIICYSLAIHSSLNEMRTAKDISGYFVDANDKIVFKITNPQTIELNENEKIESSAEINTELVESVSKNISYKYPYEALKNIESKASVAVMAHKGEEKDYSFTAQPAFASKEGLTPAQRGTATHRFMQYCNFENARHHLSEEVERLYEEQYLTAAEKKAIDLVAVSKFFENDIYSRIKASKSVHREMRFLTEVSAGLIDPTLEKELADEKVVVQGQVDCAFIEDDGIVVLDFKTDRAKGEETLIEAYKEQLEIYASACEKIFDKPIKEKVIYSFSLSKTIKL